MRSEVFKIEEEDVVSVLIAQDTHIAAAVAISPLQRKRLVKDVERIGDLSNPVKTKTKFESVAVSDIVAIKNERGSNCGVSLDYKGKNGKVKEVGISVPDESYRRAIVENLAQRFGFLSRREVVGKPSNLPLIYTGIALFVLTVMLILSLAYDLSEPSSRVGKAGAIRGLAGMLGPVGLGITMIITVVVGALCWLHCQKNPPTHEEYTRPAGH